MYKRLSCLAAMVMVLLPIGGLSYNAEAGIPPEAAVQHGHAAWMGLGVLAEPGMISLIFMGSLWLLLRLCSRRSKTTAQES